MLTDLVTRFQVLTAGAQLVAMGQLTVPSLSFSSLQRLSGGLQVVQHAPQPEHRDRDSQQRRLQSEGGQWREAVAAVQQDRVGVTHDAAQHGDQRRQGRMGWKLIG